MAAEPYYIGNVAVLRAEFRLTSTNALTDPTSVTCRVRKPDGTTVTPTASSTATGIWTAEQTLDQAGDWWYEFTGTGAVTAAKPEMLRVLPDRVP